MSFKRYVIVYVYHVPEYQLTTRYIDDHEKDSCTVDHISPRNVRTFRPSPIPPLPPSPHLLLREWQCTSSNSISHTWSIYILYLSGYSRRDPFFHLSEFPRDEAPLKFRPPTSHTASPFSPEVLRCDRAWISWGMRNAWRLLGDAFRRPYLPIQWNA